MADNIPAPIRIAEKLARIDDHWRPKVVGELNGQEVKLVKFRAGSVDLAAGDLLIVPRGMEHRPVSTEEVAVLIFEPAGVRNTGNVEPADLTAPGGVRL